jgi:hypothetical protein
MSAPSPQRIRIGEGRGRIANVGPDTIAYVDEGGANGSIDLASCCRSPESRIVGLRGALDKPPWFQFFGPQSVRMEFESDRALYRELLIPLSRADYGSLDGC